MTKPNPETVTVYDAARVVCIRPGQRRRAPDGREFDVVTMFHGRWLLHYEGDRPIAAIYSVDGQHGVFCVEPGNRRVNVLDLGPDGSRRVRVAGSAEDLDVHLATVAWVRDTKLLIDVLPPSAETAADHVEKLAREFLPACIIETALRRHAYQVTPSDGAEYGALQWPDHEDHAVAAFDLAEAFGREAAFRRNQT